MRMPIDALLKRFAAYPAMTARSADLSMMAGSACAAGMPKMNEFIKGDAMAVSNPTRHPYLYAPTSVKKYIGNQVTPPCGIR